MRPTLVLATAAALGLGMLGLGVLEVGPAAAEQPSADRAKPPKVYGAVLGQVGAGACNVGSTPAAVVIDTAGVGTPTYVAPADGVLTRFSHQANGVAGQVRAIVFADGSMATQKAVVAASPKVTVTANTLNSFAIRLPVKAGQRLGLGFTTNNMACAIPAGYGGDATLVKAPFDPDTSSAFVTATVLSGGPGVTFRPNISAVLESDVDGDGWGDLTQDGCIQSAKVTATCPDTTVTRKPRHKSTRRQGEGQDHVHRVDRRLDVPVPPRRPQEVEDLQVSLQEAAGRGQAHAADPGGQPGRGCRPQARQGEVQDPQKLTVADRAPRCSG